MKNKAIGIVAEYNPFHNGHAYQIQQAKKLHKDAPIMVVMSGNFVQRGEIALLDKWSRAELAILGGADLVLELPTAYCVRSADYFAYGAVKTLLATGMLGTLAFGVENKSAIDENKLAKFLNTTKAKKEFQELMQTNNLSYAAAWEKVAENYLPGAENCLRGANNILGFSYRKVLLQSKSTATIFPIERIGADHNDQTLKKDFSSASSIRKTLLKENELRKIKNVVPANIFKVLAKQDLTLATKTLSELFAYATLDATPEDIYNSSNASLGLCTRLLNQKKYLSDELDVYTNKIVTKRYSEAGINRLILQVLLKEKRNFWRKTQEPAYIRVLAFNSKGRMLLKEMKNTATLPIINKLGRLKEHEHSVNYNKLLKLDLKATDLYYLLKNKPGLTGQDFLTSPLYL